MKKITTILISFTLFLIIINYAELSIDNFIETRKNVIYNKTTIFSINGRMPLSLTYTILTPQCMFSGNYSSFDCKLYTQMFLDIDCTLQQEINILDHDGNPDYYLYLSPEYFNFYDSRLNIHNHTKHNWIRLSPGISCQTNNICLFVNSFILSYKKWDKVPYSGNNITLNCTKFSVYSFV